jgi:hypothetical protein
MDNIFKSVQLSVIYYDKGGFITLRATDRNVNYTSIHLLKENAKTSTINKYCYRRNE